MKVNVEVLVNAPIQKVWDVVADIENAGAYIDGLTKIEILEPAKEGLLGLKWRETRVMFGQKPLKRCGSLRLKRENPIKQELKVMAIYT